MSIVMWTMLSQYCAIGHRRHSSINAAGSPNRLKIEMAGDELTFYCNGQRLTTLRDSAFQSGELAFGTATFDEGQGVVRFSNLLVRGR
ncbi:hypothetical protein [Roseiflexus sp.]|uniref:hypothetical protein n=1 Tax=Roseiflexus sp. TaxID=2562120 RepID=UPI00398A6C95